MNIKSILDGDDPILDVFKNVAPGTDRHCINVSLLCESVGKSIENVDLENLVAAARIHDIGKCNNPQYFSENQDKENIHDRLEPDVSYQYISRHIADGVLALIQMDCPREVIKIVSEHHGDTVIGAIHAKTTDISEDFFRYKSSKPTTKEACVLMICDVVESAARAYFTAGKLDDEMGLVDKLLSRLIDDEQLDILTIGEIRAIKRALVKEIRAIYHKRVEYGDEDKDSVEP